MTIDMQLASGTLVGPYLIDAPLGAGGMGEVYRAQDTRLGRAVALKVLPEAVARDRDRLARFEREARAASALNHPHIVSIFDTGRHGDVVFIVMELVEGQDVSAWLARERPDLRRLLEVLVQVADALAAAHDAGIVHRDVKPANVLVTSQGYAKVVDFGLAKLADEPSTGEALATMTGPLSRPGMVLGTVAYMSPEQAQGLPVDARSDVFSLGAVLYEAVAGRRPFVGDTDIDVLHAIVRQVPPPLQRFVPVTPPALQWVTDKALAKDRDQRYQSMKEFAADLKRLRRWLDEPSSTAVPELPRPSPARRWPVAIAGAVGALVAMAALFAVPAVRAWLTAGPGPAQHPVTLTPLTVDPGYEGEPTLSPDGQTVAYVSDRTGNFEVFLRQVSGGPDLNLTDHPADDVQPAFSPDGKQIAFVSSREGSPLRYSTAEMPLLGGDIWVMSALGGAARRVAAGNFPAWSPDGRDIYFTAGRWFERHIYRVPATGGTPREVPITFATPVGARGQPGLSPDQLMPSVSPDGRFLSFASQSSVYVVPVAGGEARAVAAGNYPQWVASPPGIVYTSYEPGRNRSLWRLPFSSATGRVVGPAVPMTVGRGADLDATVSSDGRRVAYAAVTALSNVETVRIDVEAGRVTGDPTPITRGNDEIYFMNLSPDGRSLVYASRRGIIQGVWKVTGGSVPIQLSLDPRYRDIQPRWSPDGRTIALSRQQLDGSDPSAIWIMRPDGADPRPLGISGFNGFFAWTPDGRAIIHESPADRQVWRFDLASSRSTRLTDEPRVMPVLAVSPDGTWIAYQSTATEQGNTAIRAIPMAGGPSRLVAETEGNAYHPMFSPSGRWLYFQIDHQDLYRVPGPAQGWARATPQRVTGLPVAGQFLEDAQLSADGRLLYFSRRTLSADVWILDLGAAPAADVGSPR